MIENDNKSKRRLEIGQMLKIDDFGLCTVAGIFKEMILSNYYYARTKLGDRIVICWNPMMGTWIQFSKH